MEFIEGIQQLPLSCCEMPHGDVRVMKIDFLLVGVLMFLISACNRGLPDKLITSGYDESDMEQATARARSEVDWFVAEKKKGQGDDFAVKVRVTDADATEHFWLTGISYGDEQFEGSISNEPGIVHNVKIGQKWKVKKTEISDWMFRRDGKIHGNYTMRPLLKTMPPEEAAKYRALLAKPLTRCSTDDRYQLRLNSRSTKSQSRRSGGDCVLTRFQLCLQPQAEGHQSG